MPGFKRCRHAARTIANNFTPGATNSSNEEFLQFLQSQMRGNRVLNIFFCASIDNTHVNFKHSVGKIRRLQIVPDFRNCLDGGIIYARTKARRASKRSGLSFVAMPQVFQPVATKFSTSAARFSNASYNSRFSKKLSESS